MATLLEIIHSALNDFLLREGFTNKDYPLYCYCGYNKLMGILTHNNLESRYWDGDECICFTRDKRYIVDNTTAKIARVTIDPKKIPFNKNIYLKPFAYVKGRRTESEERICSRNRESFTLENAYNFITQIDVLADFLDSPVRHQRLENVLQNCGMYYNKIFFITTEKDFKKGTNRFALNAHDFKQYMNSEIYKEPTEMDRDRRNREILDYAAVKYPEDNYYLNQKLNREKIEKLQRNCEEFLRELTPQQQQKIFDFCEYFKQYESQDDMEMLKSIEGLKDFYEENDRDWDVLQFMYTFFCDDGKKNYEPIDFLNDCFIIVSDAGFKNITDKEGNFLLPFWCTDIKKKGYDADEYPYWRITANGQQNIFDTVSKKLISPTWFYRIGINEHNGIFRVKRSKDKKYNFIRKGGELVSKTWFDWVDDFEDNGMADVDLDGKYYTLYMDGTVVDDNGNKVDL